MSRKQVSAGLSADDRDTAQTFLGFARLSEVRAVGLEELPLSSLSNGSSLTSEWMDRKCAYPSHLDKNWQHKLVGPPGVSGQ